MKINPLCLSACPFLMMSLLDLVDLDLIAGREGRVALTLRRLAGGASHAPLGRRASPLTLSSAQRSSLALLALADG